MIAPAFPSARRRRRSAAFRLFGILGEDRLEVTDEQHVADMRIGYFRVLESEAFGCIGGLLVVTVDGRPVEFHCTEPVQTNRAQEILYGPTLRSYVVGDRIGGALLSNCKARLDVLLATDADEASAAHRAGIPSAVVDGDDVAVRFEGAIAAAIRRLAETVDINEPFGRIAAAVEEAQRIHGAGDADAVAA